MSPSARYTTQSSAYDKLLVGKPLTDRTIARRKKQWYFNNGELDLQRKEKVKKSKQKPRDKSFDLNKLMKDFAL